MGFGIQSGSQLLMWWQRKTSIGVKTRDDLVAALKTAPDEIIIEGDDRLVEEAEKLIAENTEKVDDRQIYPSWAGDYSPRAADD